MCPFKRRTRLKCFVLYILLDSFFTLGYPDHKIQLLSTLQLAFISSGRALNCGVLLLYKTTSNWFKSINLCQQALILVYSKWLKSNTNAHDNKENTSHPLSVLERQKLSLHLFSYI